MCEDYPPLTKAVVVKIIVPKERPLQSYRKKLLSIWSLRSLKKKFPHDCYDCYRKKNNSGKDRKATTSLLKDSGQFSHILPLPTPLQCWKSLWMDTWMRFAIFQHKEKRALNKLLLVATIDNWNKCHQACGFNNKRLHSGTFIIETMVKISSWLLQL